ncbi:MAG: DUF1573 domain-containing protein [Planctomycetota bacterium]|nr:DUF1573 domain-containing protein [Planctomycetota bacterium]
MQKNVLHKVGLVGLGLALLFGAWFVYANTVGKPMLDGALEYDHGLVWIDGDDAIVQYDFTLTNNTNEIFTLRQVISTCKCTTVDISDKRVIPGDSLVLSTETTLDKTGLVKSQITILLSDDRVMRLQVKAKGQRRMPLDYFYPQVDLLYNLPRKMKITCEMSDETDEPAYLQVNVPNGVTAKFGGWKLQELYDPAWQTPAMWEADLLLTRTTPEDLPLDAMLEASIDGEYWLNVPINRPDLQEYIITNSDEESSDETGHEGHDH